MIETQPGTEKSESTSVQWAADRAYAYLEKGELNGAVKSMISDLTKDSDITDDHRSYINEMGWTLIDNPDLTEQQVREFIEGFPGVVKRKVRTEVPAPEIKSEPISEADRKNAEVFIKQWIEDNEDLSDQAKELMIHKARSERGPWSHKDFVTGITHNEERVTVLTVSGESNYYF